MSILRNKYFSVTTVSDNELSQHEIRTNDQIPCFQKLTFQRSLCKLFRSK